MTKIRDEEFDLMISQMFIRLLLRQKEADMI